MKETEWERHALPTRWRRVSGFRSTNSRPLRPRGETESFSLCTMAATRCARSERYTGISKSTVSRIARAYVRVKAQAELSGIENGRTTLSQADSANKILKTGTNTTDYFCPSSMPSRVRQASSAHLTRAGIARCPGAGRPRPGLPGPPRRAARHESWRERVLPSDAPHRRSRR